MRLSNSEIRAVGLDFIEFLHETQRFSITQRDELRDIYQREFRNRHGARDPNFSSLLFVLRNSNKARVTRDRHVYFKDNVRVLQDQWLRPGERQPSASVAGRSASRSLPSQNAQAASSPPPGPEEGVRARRKLAQEILKKLSNERSEFVADKHGVRVSSERETVDGRMHVCVDSADDYEWKVYVENTGQHVVDFTYYSPLHWIQCFRFDDSKKVTRNNPLSLLPGERYEITVKVHSKYVGMYHATVAFEFKLSMEPRPFHIVRFIEAEFSTQLAKELAPTEPYTPFRLSRDQTDDFIVDEGERPDNLVIQRLQIEVPLSIYKCPNYVDDLIDFLKAPSSHKPFLVQKKFRLESPLDFYNYAERFELLLYLEERQMEVDIKKYDKHDVTMQIDRQNRRLLVLEVPGVSENRPSVLRGDHLLMTKSDDVNSQHITKYKGYVHRVELDRLKLGFSQRFLASFIDNMKFHVEFTVNRLPMRLQHRAVHLAVQHRLQDVLFPKESNVASETTLPSLSLFDRKLQENDEQYNAVRNIVAGVSKPAPYLVFGPPGTGKTVTMVEAIKQVEKCLPDVHILACAPSNSAADQLCEKLLEHVDTHKVYRMYASSRNPDQVPLILQEASNLKGDAFEFPHKEELMTYKIVVTTVVTAGRLVTGGVPSTHFTHIFVDEAGHAVECETIIAIAGLLHAETGMLVLAGDPKQLGPILRSPNAIKYGLGLSLLERLMTKNSLYNRTENGFNSNYVTKLLRNYRSHRAILRCPNEMFYNGELQPCADEFSTSFYCYWEHLPKKGFPLIFHGVSGKDERESNSPSFFNTSEITVVVDYLKKLLLTQGKKGIARISPKDIGIITPYRKQVEKLRKAIIKCDRELKVFENIEHLKVGSVEEFQGQERRVIIVSTVRSNSEYLTLDKEFNIGFLKNEKRFNVAVTRARALLIIVGNPVILSTDMSWSKFIDYCTEEGGCIGFNRVSVEGTEEVVTRLMALRIHTEAEGETEESSVQQYENPEWRNEQ
ncbi:putative helicase mov-10-B.1 [Tachysurus fulvidraco]|uniref:putative helicase mov-10-B.1 n=1 Tax=Tachysurus fulvidraco TaxID=1234273 RepID=UPI001FF01E38|nr:putative helicase mov-10-B.1 [Tachysurus fulvidraco]